MEKEPKNIKKYISRILKLAVLVLGAVLIYVGLDYFISDDTKARTRVNYHDFYEEASVDTIFLGPSHSIPLIDANRLTEDLGESVFNLSSSSQYLTESYAALKDACENQDIKKVYLEISPSRFCKEVNSDKSVTIITDYSKSIFPKIELITEKFDSDVYLSVALRLRRNFDPLEMVSLSDIKKIYSEKKKEAYKNYEGDKNYLGRGQWAGNDSIAVTDDNTIAINKDSTIIDNYSLDEITELQDGAFRNIINYCKNNNIELAFYVTPYTPYYLQEFKNYDKFLEYVRSVADENGIKLWDFNLAKEEYLDLPMGAYSNLDHVNMKYNSEIIDLLEMCIENPDGDYFYDSLKEKQENNTAIYAIGYTNAFITPKGEYETEDDAKGKIENVKVDVSAISIESVPCIAKVYKLDVENDDASEFEYTVVEEENGTSVDEFTTEFTLPYDKMKTYYKVELLNPDNGEVLYETITKFDME